ncbi:MAG TPA: hypothetical protein VNE40_03660 [Candidatus Dormibacteraeota bacterium]|nr:hypothetical protein [Candidatus Dormibacteraeota bacterium]
MHDSLQPQVKSSHEQLQDTGADYLGVVSQALEILEGFFPDSLAEAPQPSNQPEQANTDTVLEVGTNALNLAEQRQPDTEALERIQLAQQAAKEAYDELAA